MRHTDTRQGNLHCLYIRTCPECTIRTHAHTHSIDYVSVNSLSFRMHAPPTCTLSAISHTSCPRVSPGWRLRCAPRGPTMAAEEVGVVIQLLASFLANSLLIWQRGGDGGQVKVHCNSFVFSVCVCVSVCMRVHMPAQALIPIPIPPDCVITHSSNPFPSAHAPHPFPLDPSHQTPVASR